jgi:phosphate transport system substrate-binding protein
MNPDYYPQFAEIEFLKEARNAEREPWKIDATPELVKLGINQAEVNRWDGSTSLHPVIHAIAKRCEGVDAAALQTTINYDYRFGFAMNTVRTGKTLSNTHPALLLVIQGKKDVTFSTRRLSQKELDAAEKAGVELVQIPFAKDAFVFLQNRQNPLRNLTLEQYQDIFSGKFLKERQEMWGVHKFQTWKDVGGFGGDIVPFTRDEDSGSEELMQALVMQGVPISRQLSWKMLDSMSAVYPELARDPGAIAYTVYHYDRYMVFCPYTRVMGVNGIFPNAETIASGKYPLVYECVLVHRKDPGEKVERFVQWLLSDEGQRLVRSVGYVPMNESR